MKPVNGIWLPDYEQEMVRFLDHRPSMLDGRGSYQRSKWERAIGLCRTRRMAIDVGAHVGLWSIPLSKAFGSVMAFEPHPDHRACFERNLQGVENVFLYPFAVGDREGRVRLSVETESSGGTHIVADGDGPAADLVTIDSMAPDDAPVDLVKIDCEGFELPVLRGARETLLRCRPVVVVEQKPQHADRYGFEPLAACRFLESLGARLLGELVGDFYFRW